MPRAGEPTMVSNLIKQQPRAPQQPKLTTSSAECIDDETLTQPIVNTTGLGSSATEQSVRKSARIIVFGNEKGGSGKTTTAFHLCIALLRLGYTVASIDLDVYQRSFSRYVQNRLHTIGSLSSSAGILIPEHLVFEPSSRDLHTLDTMADVEKSVELLRTTIKDRSHYDFIIIDTPGAKTYLNMAAHSLADVVITPMNESFLDLDLIGEISPTDFELIKPGVYSEMIFAQRIKRAEEKKGYLDWIVVRNRVSMLDAINKRNVEMAITRLSKKLGFRVAPGFGDRVIFKELFLNGLTLYDATITKAVKINTSLLAAKQEMREFIKALALPEVNAILNDMR